MLLHQQHKTSAGESLNDRCRPTMPE